MVYDSPITQYGSQEHFAGCWAWCPGTSEEHDTTDEWGAAPAPLPFAPSRMAELQAE